MKTQLTKRLMACLLALTMLATAFAFVIPASASTDVVLITENEMVARTPHRIGKTFSYRANIGGEFTGFGFHMPTWTKPDSKATMAIYKWQGSYEATLKTQPIASKRYDPMTDGMCHWVEFTPQPAGEYLFHVYDVSTDVGVWTDVSPKNPKGFSYVDGIEQRGEPQLAIRFNEKPAEPFGPCEASAGIRNVVYPYTTKTPEAVFNMNGPLGMHLKVDSPFVGVQFKMATYMATDLTVDMNVYEWKGSYNATIEAEPVAGETVLLMDNAMQGITFDELPAGEYLFLTENYNKAPAMYVYTEVADFKGYVYKDGFPWTTNAQFPVMQVICSSEKDAYFGQASQPEDSVTGDHVAPPAYVIPEDSLIYTHPVMPDTWVFTDGLGRVSLTNADVGDPKEDKTLAMFYWTWHTKDMAAQGYVNTTELLAKYPDAKNNYNHPAWEGTGHYCFWNEPIYGFYTTEDPWVLRRQAELLANAGVDVIFTDNTNGDLTWRTSYLQLYKTWDDAQKNGAVDVPKVSYLLPFGANEGSKKQLESLYLDIYRPGKYQNLWFYWDDKPMLMAHSGNISAGNNLGKEILVNFTFRGGQPGYLVNSTAAKQWGWLSTYPQALYSIRGQKGVENGDIEQMTVGVAVNHNYLTHEITAMNGVNVMGRSYTTDYPDRYDQEGAEASKWGYQFSQQFDYALEVSPPVLFVTGWNEWHAWRQPNPWGGSNSLVNYALVDQFSDEFSRDLEPTKGDLQDHYYYLFVNYARKYKGVNPIPTPSGNKTIDLNAGNDQWTSVEPYYAAYIGNTFDRDSTGYGDTHYTETSGRNDIIGAQVARDGDYVYFLVECAENITPYTDSLWMNLYIDTDQQNQGWNTFEYVVGKTTGTADKLVLEKFTAADDYAKTEKVADVEYKVDGRYMTVKIAKSDLGLTGDDYTINFSWTDNVHDEGDDTKFSGDIMDFYISGDVAPGARFKYSYISTEANATGKEPTTDESDTSESDTSDSEPVAPESSEPESSGSATDEPIADTEAATNADTAAESDTVAEDGGCASSIAAAGVIAAAMAAAVALRKRKET